MLNLEALNTRPQYIRNARCKLAGSISFPVVLVLTSQMSDHDLINHALGILLVLNGALKPETKLRFHSSPVFHTPCIAISSQSVHLHQTCPSCAYHSSPYRHHKHGFIKLNEKMELIIGLLYKTKATVCHLPVTTSMGS